MTLDLTVFVQPPCAIADNNTSVHVKKLNSGSHIALFRHTNMHTLVGRGSAALAVAVALPWVGDPIIRH